MIFDDAVVHQGDVAAGDQGVRIADFRRAGGRPARVGDPGGAVNTVLTHALAQLLHAGHRARAAQGCAIKGCDPARIVSAIFQTA